MLYKIGGDHDPQGRSGMAHMVEGHLLIAPAAAAGRWRTRTAWRRSSAAIDPAECTDG